MDLTPGVARLLDRVDHALPHNPDRAARVRRYVTDLLQRAFRPYPDGSVFVATGDIPAMWLRDSAAQTRPLLAAADDPETAELIGAVVRRQVGYLLLDPYANAFKFDPADEPYHVDFADQHPLVWERKYELDSPAAVLDLGVRLFRACGSAVHLDAGFHRAAEILVDQIAREQDHDRDSYRLSRPEGPASDSLAHEGRGAPMAPIGMTWSGFRPSDDACTYGYLVPANAAAVVALRGVADIAVPVWGDARLAAMAGRLAEEIDAALLHHAVVAGPDGSDIFAYEIDGLGNALLMDDANLPSLLALPYLGYSTPDDPLYLATRAFALSAANPFYSEGRYAAGVGSPHTPVGWVWPLSLIAAGLTGTASEVEAALDTVERTDAGTGRFHEAFDPDDPRRFTRSWFSWPEMLYVHLVLRTLGLAGAAE